MALTANRFDCLAADIAAGKHANLLNAGTDVLKLALTNVAPSAANDAGYGELTEIAAGNGYTTGGASLTYTVSNVTGTITLSVAGTAVFTAAGGAMADFRYSVLYNDTAAAKPVIAYYDAGSTKSLGSGDSWTLDPDPNALITLG